MKLPEGWNRQKDSDYVIGDAYVISPVTKHKMLDLMKEMAEALDEIHSMMLKSDERTDEFKILETEIISSQILQKFNEWR